MFTGIITDVGRVRRLRHAAGGIELTIATVYDPAGIALGASIACSGVCLTVVALEPGGFATQASAETLACSTLGDWAEGTPVNLGPVAQSRTGQRLGRGLRRKPAGLQRDDGQAYPRAGDRGAKRDTGGVVRGRNCQLDPAGGMAQPPHPADIGKDPGKHRPRLGLATGRLGQRLLNACLRGGGAAKVVITSAPTL